MLGLTSQRTALVTCRDASTANMDTSQAPKLQKATTGVKNTEHPNRGKSNIPTSETNIFPTTFG